MTTTLMQVLVSFGQIGLFALGGGNSMLKLLEEECVHQRGWVTLEEYGQLVGVSYLFPGLTVIKTAGMIGMKVAGLPGMVVSIIGIAMPGLVFSALCYSLIVRYREHPIVAKLLVLMQYGAVALLAAALFSLIKPLGKDFHLQAAILSAALFFAVAVMDVSAFVGILGFVIIGLMLI